MGLEQIEVKGTGSVTWPQLQAGRTYKMWDGREFLYERVPPGGYGVVMGLLDGQAAYIPISLLSLVDE